MNRIKSIDTLRSVSIFFVILIHTAPFHNQSSPIGNTLDLATTINQLARFAVPFFFVISGYFWAQKIQSANEIYAPTISMAKRIAQITIIWSVIYIFPWNIYASFTYGLLGPIKVIYWNAYNADVTPSSVALGFRARG